MVINSSKMDFREVVQQYLEEQRYEVIEAMSESIGWTYKIEKGRLTHGSIVYGKTGTYQLAHLLEYGHAKRGGGRTNAYSHIKPVEEWAIDEVIDRTITKIERQTR